MMATIVRSCWVGTPRTAYNSWTAHGIVINLGISTVLWMPVKELEAHGCKPLITKLASFLHTHLRSPQLCSLCKKEFHCECLMSSWDHKIGSRLVSLRSKFAINWAHRYCVDLFYSFSDPADNSSMYIRGSRWCYSAALCCANIGNPEGNPRTYLKAYRPLRLLISQSYNVMSCSLLLWQRQEFF